MITGNLFKKNRSIIRTLFILIGCLLFAPLASANWVTELFEEESDTMTTVCETLNPDVVDGVPLQTLSAYDGEKHLVRELTGDDQGAGVKSNFQNQDSLAYFYLLADPQITDEESPNRLIYYDHLIDSAWRPQEDRTVHVFNAAVRAGNGIMNTYERDFDFIMNLGDNADNAQKNEHTWFLQVLKGEEVNPDSGFYEISGEIFHDEGRTFGRQSQYVPYGDESNDPFYGAGVNEGVPVYTVVGNHDVLWTGNFNENFIFNNILNFFNPDDFVSQYSRCPLFPIWCKGFVPAVPPPPAVFNLFNFPVCVSNDGCDPFQPKTFYDREFIGYSTYVEWMKDEGLILQSEGVPENMGYYYFDDESAPIRYIVMDTEDRPYFSEGGVGNAQFNWITEKISEATDRFVVLMSHHQTEDGLLCILCDYKDGDDLKNLFCDYPNVILVLNGHGHDNRVLAQECPAGKASSGFWEVETASLADFPQQARVIEIAYNNDGTGSIFTTIMDHKPEYAGGIADESRTDSWIDINNEYKMSKKGYSLEVDEEGEIWKVTGSSGEEVSENWIELDETSVVDEDTYSVDVDDERELLEDNLPLNIAEIARTATARGTRYDRNVELIFPVPENIAAVLDTLESGPPTTQKFHDICAEPTGAGGCATANAASGGYSPGQVALDLLVYMLPILVILGWLRRKSRLV